jgi:hypothetical protein
MGNEVYVLVPVEKLENALKVLKTSEHSIREQGFPPTISFRD